METGGYVDLGDLLVPKHAAEHRSTRAVFYLPDGTTLDVDPDLPPIPAGLLHLDVWAGRAVPHVAWRTPEGNVDLAEVDGQRYMTCLDERACAMCALPLGYWIAFLVEADDTTAARAHRVMTEPPMHRPCARYAQRVWWPDRRWLYVTRSYDVRDADHATRPKVAYAAPAREVEDLTPARVE